VKIAVSGKGGVGKTTLAALLALYLADKGREVIAVDADPDANLASALGVPKNRIPVPISQMRELIQERTGSKGDYGGYFKINPYVDDVPEKFCVRIGNVRLLVLGGVRSGGSGCICPESALLKALVMHLVLSRDEVVILDMEAGIEHLGRATAQGVSAMIIVVEPGARSIETAHTIKRLGGEIHIPHVGVVINKVLPGLPTGPIAAALNGLPVLGTIPYDQSILRADMDDRSPYTGSPSQLALIEGILHSLEKMLAQ